MPAARKPAKRRSPPPSLPARLGLPDLEQRHLDVAGLALVALGVFFSFIFYMGWEGGRMGDALAGGFVHLLGAIAYLVPLALFAAGALMVMRPALPAVRPFRAGGACLFAALTLGLAAGTLGLGPDQPRTGQWESALMESRGGLMGEALFWLAATLFQTLGAHLIAIFLFLSGLLLLTGASVASVVRATGTGVAGTTRRIGQSTQEVAAVVSRRAPRRGPSGEDVTARVPAGGEPANGTDAEPGAEDPGAAMEVPEPGPGELQARMAGRSELDGAKRYPDLFGEVPAWDGPGAGGGEPAADPVAGAERDEEPAPPPSAGALPAAREAPEDGQEPEADGAADETPVGRRLEAGDLTPQGRLRGSVTDAHDFPWHPPDPRVLKRSRGAAARPDTAGQEKVAARLVEALGHFGVQARIVGMVVGPHITRYELRLAPGIKVGKVAQLKDDLAYALAATEIRILAPIPGKQAVGVEVPNANRRTVHLGDVYGRAPADWSPLTVWLGKDVAGRAVGADLAKMPHLLVAGTTGAGKSGAINAMLTSVLLRATPHEVRIVLVDPKQVELNHYESVPHLLTPVITHPKKAANALQNLVREMEERYGTMSLARTRSLPELNRARAQRDQPPLPYILCVIDELADLMMVAPADVEDAIIRLAQKARAVGIHLVLATQSPRVDVITGMIKANVPSRIAFAVSSQTDSRVILDQNGAESLLGQGDMLFAPVGTSRLQRIQGAYVDEGEIAQITDWWGRQGEPEFHEELLEEVESESESGDEGDEGFDPDEDPLLEEAIGLVAGMGTASTSMLQRRLRLGYTRAGRLIDMLERRGVISGYEGSKPRQVLISEADAPRIIAQLSGGGGSAEAEPDALRGEPAPVGPLEDAITIEETD
jgi:DNA segregation ATPase FtsK/SpoIIIE, S-DNA-T family